MSGNPSVTKFGIFLRLNHLSTSMSCSVVIVPAVESHLKQNSPQVYQVGNADPGWPHSPVC
jgi:hypothetical protein